MANEETRRGSDGRLYPRLRVRKFQDGSPLPWHVEKLYGPTPYAKRDLIYTVDEARKAHALAGQTLDAGIMAEAKKPKITAMVEIHKLVSPRRANMGHHDPELFLS